MRIEARSIARALALVVVCIGCSSQSNGDARADAATPNETSGGTAGVMGATGGTAGSEGAAGGRGGASAGGSGARTGTSGNAGAPDAGLAGRLTAFYLDVG